jgi:hypothetical protein
MTQLEAYDPPGHLTDFDGIDGQREQWSRAVSNWFDSAAARQAEHLRGQRCQYFNQLTDPPTGPALEQEIVWNGFPGTLRRRWGRDRALLVADHVLPLSLRMDSTETYLRGGVWDRLFYRPQDEYCEWRVTRDERGRITRVTFTSEPPEYWQALHGDALDTDGDGEPDLDFTGDRDRLVELYRTHVDERVRYEDLVCPADLYSGGGLLYREGEYNPYNRWNTTDGIMHLTHPSNTLQAEISLGGDATVLRERGGRRAADADTLIACAGYGGANRCSDPTIGGSVNHLAALGFGVTLANPVGLYMDHLDMTGWTAGEDEEPIDPAWFRLVRGQPGLIERAVFEPPEGETRTVSDVRIGGVPIRHGGQLAECMTVKLIGLADLGRTIGNDPSGFPHTACAERDNPWMVRTLDPGEPLPLGYEPVFSYAEAISAGRAMRAPSPPPPPPLPSGPTLRTRR